MIGDVMYLHHHSNLSTMMPIAKIAEHRMAYIGLAVFLVRLTEILVPVESVSPCVPFVFCTKNAAVSNKQ